MKNRQANLQKRRIEDEESACNVLTQVLLTTAEDGEDISSLLAQQVPQNV